MERLQRNNYNEMQMTGSSHKPTSEAHGTEIQNIISDEGWTPELLDWFIAAISVALERPENRELVTNLKRGSRL